MPEQQTRVLADRYELIAPLGRGTMGTVWRAHDRSLGREVAIKEIRQEPGLSEAQRAELRERMIREGRTAARISHPSVATVHDAIVEDGSPWIIMELVQARSLEQVIEEEGPLPPRLVAEIGADLLGALRAAHAQGVLHRDVKPGNVLITESGRVVLTDFGIAKAEGDTSLTKTGMVIGSPGYTAPERARGEHTGPESDLWSLGATLYFAVEGRPAYERASVAETLAALMSEQVDPPTQAGPLRPLLEQLLEKDHSIRMTAAQASAMLRAVADTPSHLADSITVPPPAEPSPAPQAPAARDEDEADGFDADRTMMIIRPRDGLRIPGGAAPVAEPPPPPPRRPAASPYPDSAPLTRPDRPVVGRQGPPGLGTPVARGPATPANRAPGAFRERGDESSATAPHGFPIGGGDDPAATPPHGFPAVETGFGAPGAPAPRGFPPTGIGTPPGQENPGAPMSAQPWPPPGPNSPDDDFGHSSGLGTDLFAFASRPDQHVPGEPKAPSERPQVGILILMGVAAIALLVIMILAVVAFG